MSLRLIATSYQGQRLAPGQKSIMFIDKGEITIGRAQDNDWVLPDPDRRLSRRHCIRPFDGRRWWCEWAQPVLV